MFLKDIELTNFKALENIYLSFETSSKRDPIRKTTFLLGQNGTGKSALLKAIALVTAGSSSLGNLLGSPDDWVKTGKKFCEIAATLLTAKGEERHIRLRIEKDFSLASIISQNKESLELIDNAIANADRNYFVIGYGASRRLNRDSQLVGADFSSPRSLNIQSLFNPDAVLVSLTGWAMDLDYTQKGDGLRTVRKALDTFLVDNVRFKSIDKTRKQLIFSTPDGSVPLNQLSDGYQNVTAWVGDLMYRINETFRDFKDPLKARGLLLIDEIDLHLHPKWQRQLHAFLRNKLPNFQIIGTTHSPLTAQQADEGELYALTRTGRKIELVAFRGTPNKMLIHQILMSPVFGLETDESVKIEEAKTKVRKIRSKGKVSAKDKSNIKKYSKILDATPVNVRTNALLSSDDLELLRTINQELKSNKES